MRKSESILYMQYIGLNTLECLITNNIDKAIAYIQEHKGKRLSMRTERGYEFLCPFYYNISGEELISHVTNKINTGYTLLLYPYLDYRDSLSYGTVGFMENGDIIVEYVAKSFQKL